MTDISFFIPIIPKAQKRARARAIPLGGGKFTAQTYKDKSQRVEEDNFRALLYQYAPTTPLAGPISLMVTVNLPIPKSKSKKWKLAAMELEILPTGKPDLDNLLKHLKDCMKGIFYVDDCQVVAIEAKKIYSATAGWDIYFKRVQTCE